MSIHFITGNRKIDPTNLASIKDSFSRGIIEIPIICDPEMGVHDGQHRFEAYRDSEEPVPFVVVHNCSIDRISDINVGKPWKLIDYIQSHADQGTEDYLQLVQLMEVFPQIRHARFYAQVAYETTYGKGSFVGKEYEVHNGTFKFADFDKAKTIMEQLMDYKPDNFGNRDTYWGKYLFFASVYDVMSCKEYDHERMIHKLKAFPSRLIRNATKRGYIMNLSEIYNYSVTSGKRVHFDTILNVRY